MVQFFTKIMIVAVLSFALIRSFGSSLAYFFRLLMAGIRGRAFETLVPVIVVAIVAFAGYVMIESSYELLLPREGQEYVQLPVITRAGEWITDMLSQLSPELPPLP